MTLNKIFFYTCLLSSLLFTNRAFSGNIDSLLLELQNQENEVEKISILNQIGGELVETNQDSADS